MRYTFLLIAWFFIIPAALAQNLGMHERIKVYGQSLEGNLEGDDPSRNVSVYLPPGYQINSNQRFPVLYFLHGFTDSDGHWFGLESEHFVNIPDAVDAALQKGAREMIVVMPDAYTRYQGSMYSNSVVTGNWEAFIAEELVEFIDANYRTIPHRESRGLAGHSMGGQGALRIGMKYPEVFSSLYAMSPCCLAPNMSPDPRLMELAADVRTDQEFANAGFLVKAEIAKAVAWSPNPLSPPYYDLPMVNGEIRPDIVAKQAANAVNTIVHQYIHNIKQFDAIHFDSGDQESSITPTVRDLSQIFSDYQIDHVSEVYDGNHLNRIHERIIDKVIPMFSEKLSFE